MATGYETYFFSRGVDPSMYKNARLPGYVRDELPDKRASVLDVGCGFGQNLHALINDGYTNVRGLDLSDQAVAYCKEQGLPVEQEDIMSYALKEKVPAYDIVWMNHVLEHLPKDMIIPMVTRIKEKLIKPGGKFLVMVPNAQSNTNCYWAYEDFTHNTLFTAGSLLYVLRESGYRNIKFLDEDGLYYRKGWEKTKYKFLLKLYRKNRLFWNKVTNSSYHRPSPIIFTYELKCLAVNE